MVPYVDVDPSCTNKTCCISLSLSFAVSIVSSRCCNESFHSSFIKSYNTTTLKQHVFGYGNERHGQPLLWLFSRFAKLYGTLVLLVRTAKEAISLAEFFGRNFVSLTIFLAIRLFLSDGVESSQGGHVS